MEILRFDVDRGSIARRDDDRAALIRTVADIVPIECEDLAVRIGGISTAEMIAMASGQLRVPSWVVTGVAMVLVQELGPLQRFLLDRGHTIQSYCLRPTAGRRPKS